jgi:hypothetical protein
MSNALNWFEIPVTDLARVGLLRRAVMEHRKARFA